MQRSDLKRPRYFIPLGLILALVVVSAIIFNPAFQKKMLLQYAGPLVDSLEISYIHFTPWSLKLDKVAVGYKGGLFQIGDGSIRYCLSSLLLMKLNLKRLTLQDVSVDLTGFKPPAKPAEIPEQVTSPFPGVLASLQHGLGYELQALNIKATVALADEQSVTVNISGGGIKPKASGRIHMDVRFDTGKQQDHIEIAGTVRLDQLTRGRFSAIQTTLDLQAALASLPEAERVNANLVITPESDKKNRRMAEDNGTPYVQPESIHLSLLQKDDENITRSSLKLNGVYNGNNGNFSNGNYRVAANERLLQRYAGEKVLPTTQEMLSGNLNFNITDLTGNITIISDLLITDLKKTQSNDQLPELLRLKNNLRISLLTGNHLRIEKLDTGLSDDQKTHPLAANLPADLNIPLDNIDSFLHQENTLLEFTLPAVPLKWLDVFLPEQNITAGQLTAAFQITTDTSSAIHLKPIKPLEIRRLTITQADAPLIDNLNLSVLPSLTYSGDILNISLDELITSAGKRTLATGYLKATLPLSEEQKGSVNAQANIDLNTKSLLHLLAIKQTGKQNLPRHFSLNFQTDIMQQPTSIVVSKLDATLAKDKKTRLLNLHLQQPLTLETGETGTKFKNLAGTLATLNVSDIQLNWFSSFVPDTTLKGKIYSTDFTLVTNTEGVATIRSTRPFKINNVSVADKNGPLLKNLGIRLLPIIRLSPDSTGITYRNLAITSNETRLLTGNGRIHLPAKAGKPLLANGQLDIDLQKLSKQPLIAKLLQAEFESPVRLEADYKLAQGKTRIDISKLSASIFYQDDAPKVSLQADSKVRIHTRLSGKISELDRISGKVTLVVDNLTPEPFKKILAANGLQFTTANGKAELNSSGKLLDIKTIEPFVIKGLKVNNKDTELLQAFTLTAGTETTLQGNTLHSKLSPFTINFDSDKQSHAIQGTVNLTLKGSEDSIYVDTLNADLNLLLPPILGQPAIMLGHTLIAGKLTSVTTVNSSGQLDSTTRIQGLKSKQDLPLELLEIKVGGQIEADGSFDLKAPIKTLGKTGESDLLIKAVHSTQQAASNDIAIDINSTVLYLNDLLNTLKAIAGEQAEEKQIEEEKSADADSDPALELQADERAFWDTLPYNFTRPPTSNVFSIQTILRFITSRVLQTFRPINSR